MKKKKIDIPEVVKKVGDISTIEHALIMGQTEVSKKIEAIHEELEELENQFEVYEEALIELGIISDLRNENDDN